MSPDTQQNIAVMAKLVLEHNFLAIVFLGGLVCSTAYALYKPSRGIIVMMIGFALLLFAFEYEKHIADGLIEQTKGSLITERQSFRLDWIVEKFLGRAATPLLYLMGVVCEGSGIYMLWKSRAPKKHFKSPIIN